VDVYKALSELYGEKKRLDSAISALEARLALMSKPEAVTRGRRGRRSMGMEERESVSRRMSRYWADRRAKKNRVQAMPYPSESAPAMVSAQIQDVA
jgi:hypothetical protein